MLSYVQTQCLPSQRANGAYLISIADIKENAVAIFASLSYTVFNTENLQGVIRRLHALNASLPFMETVCYD